MIIRAYFVPMWRYWIRRCIVWRLISLIALIIIQATLILEICIAFAVTLWILLHYVWLCVISLVSLLWHLLAQRWVPLSTLSCAQSNSLLVLLLSKEVLAKMCVVVGLADCQFMLIELLRVVDAATIVWLVDAVDVGCGTCSTLN